MHLLRTARAVVLGLLFAIMMVAVSMLSSCAGTASIPLEPKIVTKEVKVEVPVPCKALVQLGPEPVYPDTDQAINDANSIGELAAIYAKGRILRFQRLAEYATAKAACVF